MKKFLSLSFLMYASFSLALAADWPQWGNDASRNMVSSETGLASTWAPGKFKGNTEEIDMATTKGVKWIAKLGSQTYGNPTVAGGRVYVGTNNESPRDPKYATRERDGSLKGLDRGILLCLDEKTGNLLWQLAVPKLGTGKVSDWEYLGICSSPAVEGDRVYIVTNRCEAMCLDVNGLANGNDGVKDEGAYFAEKGKPAVTLGPKDADIIWRFDMIKELQVFPHNITNCGPLLFGDRLVVTTSNGVDWTHTNIPNPRAPCLVMLDKRTGALLGEEASGVAGRTLHSNWSSPAYGKVGNQEMIIFGGGDGWLYAYDTKPVPDRDGINLFKELWKFDCNPPHYRMKAGKAIKYATPEGPSEVIATPCFVNGRVYVPIGQDPEHGEGIGNIVCLNAATGKPVWQNDKINRSLSTPVIHNGLLYVADFSGYVYAMDANDGKTLWKYDTKSHIWSSPLVADGKVYVGTEDGDIVVLAADRTMKEVGKVDMRAPVYSSAIVANGTVYIGTQTHLYAIGK